jgi:hypothetical protein
MLLNEFLKAHRKMENQNRKMQEQEAMIGQLKKDFQMISAQQRREVQLLSAQLQEQRKSKR